MTTITGTSGNDTLNGTSAHDEINALAGDDILTGFAANDLLTGGAGDDIFKYNHYTDSGPLAGINRDVITDFTSGEDIIDVRGIADMSGESGPLNDNFHWTTGSSFDGTAGSLYSVQIGDHAYVRGDVNGDGTIDFAIQVLNHAALTASDFLLS